jgi:hypothetical protein
MSIIAEIKAGSRAMYIVGPDETLAMFVIYDHPVDFPANVVIRPWLIMRGMSVPVPAPAGAEILCDSIEEARSLMPPHMAALPRADSDALSVVETWI